jgi:hypothetical protein
MASSSSSVVVGTLLGTPRRPLYYVFLVTFALVPWRSSPACSAAGSPRSGVADLLVELGRGTPLGCARALASRPVARSRYWLPEREQFVLPDGTQFHAAARG